MRRHGISMPDRQLACVPLRSEEGATYLGAMAAAANFAWANRQVMTGLVERAFLEVLGIGPAALGFGLVYDVCHNVAKMEEHVVGGRARRVCVHRKGATRAFGPGHPALPESVAPSRPAGDHPRRHGPALVRAARRRRRHGRDASGPRATARGA